MERYINPDSDGKFYSRLDMVKTNCHDCKGCHACCTDMGDSIVLDPFDVWQLTEKRNLQFRDLLEGGQIAFTVQRGQLLPYLSMNEHKDSRESTCSFLDEAGRCTIHDARPGICRLFPMGRDFTDGRLSYIFLEQLCPAQKSKIKVDKWLGISKIDDYEDFIVSWYAFRKQIQSLLSDANELEQRQLNEYLIHQFFLCDYTQLTDFYGQTKVKMNKVLQAFGLDSLS